MRKMHNFDFRIISTLYNMKTGKRLPVSGARTVRYRYIIYEEYFQNYPFSKFQTDYRYKTKIPNFVGNSRNLIFTSKRTKSKNKETAFFLQK